jgi:hypothetical protein
MLIPSPLPEGAALMSGNDEIHVGHGSTSSESQNTANPKVRHVSNVPGWQESCQI